MKGIQPMKPHDSSKKRVAKPGNFKPVSHFALDHPTWPGAPRCQSWSPNRGAQCSKPAMTGKIRCGTHGGRTPVGADSPHFKTGTWSRYVPRGIQQDFLNAMSDPNWLALRESIAVLVARLNQISRKIDTKESPAGWEQVGEQAASIGEAVADYKEAARSKDLAKMGASIMAIEEMAKGITQLCHNGLEVNGLWQESYDVLERHRRMVESEGRLRLELRQVISKEKALVLFGSLIETFRQAVKSAVDPDKAREIMLTTQTRVQKLLN